MKFTTLLLTAVLAFSICNVKSQFPGQNSMTPANALEEIKANNDALLKKQEATIKTLEGLLESSRQIKIFSKRA